MKWRLIKESEEKFDIKKALKENGIKKIPSKVSIFNDQMEFEKKKGYSGEKTIDAMLEQVKGAGWTKGGVTSGMSADGSSAGRSNEYVSPDGILKFSFTKYYGSSSYDNFFRFTFKRIKNPDAGISSESLEDGFTTNKEVTKKVDELIQAVWEDAKKVQKLEAFHIFEKNLSNAIADYWDRIA